MPGSAEVRPWWVEVGAMGATQTHVFFSFFFFFLYHAFIVSRYKKFRAALAMEKTKPIKQNKQQQKKPYRLESSST